MKIAKCGPCEGDGKVKLKYKDRLKKKICPYCKGTGESITAISKNKKVIEPGTIGHFFVIERKTRIKYYGKVYYIQDYGNGKMALSIQLLPKTTSSRNVGFRSCRPEDFIVEKPKNKPILQNNKGTSKPIKRRTKKTSKKNK